MYISLKMIIKLYFPKIICLVSDKACDIGFSMHFYVHKKYIFFIFFFFHFFYAVEESLAVLSHRSFEIAEGAT